MSFKVKVHSSTTGLSTDYFARTILIQFQKYTEKSVGQYKLAMKIKRRERDKNRKLKNRVNTGIFTAASSEPEP